MLRVEYVQLWLEALDFLASTECPTLLTPGELMISPCK